MCLFFRNIKRSLKLLFGICRWKMDKLYLVQVTLVRKATDLGNERYIFLWKKIKGIVFLLSSCDLGLNCFASQFLWPWADWLIIVPDFHIPTSKHFLIWSLDQAWEVEWLPQCVILSFHSFYNSGFIFLVSSWLVTSPWVLNLLLKSLTLNPKVLHLAFLMLLHR